MVAKKICLTEAIALIIISVINRIILGIPKSLLLNSAFSATITIILASIITILLILLINKLFKEFIASDILDISEFLAGSFLKKIIGIIYIILFIGISTLCLSYICDVLKSIYFESNDKLFLALFFIIGIVIVNRMGFNSIVKSNLFIVILTTIIMIIMFILSIQMFVPERFFPLLGFGIEENYFANLTDIFAFSGLVYIMFIFPFFKNTQEFYKTNIISTIIITIYLTISTICLLLVFPNSVISESIFNMYVLARLADLGEFLRNTDCIYLLFWILSIFSYLSINMFFITNIFKKITNLKNQTAIVYSFSLILFASIILINNITSYNFLLNTVYKYYMIAVIVLSIIILILANIKKNKRSNQT